jgi:hypothetical protein
VGHDADVAIQGYWGVARHLLALLDTLTDAYQR